MKPMFKRRVRQGPLARHAAVIVTVVLAGCGAGALNPAAISALTQGGGQAQVNAANTAASAAGKGLTDAPFNMSTKAESELLPDRACARPQEKFNIMEKVIDYGGQSAQLRLLRMVESDFQFSDLKPEDKKLLKYLAYTTIWVPVEVEVQVSKFYTLVGARAAKLTKTDEALRTTLQERLVGLRGNLPDYPAEVRLGVDPAISDGVFAQLGGLVQISQGFLEILSERNLGRDLVFAHELSHIYKRHRVKQLQSQLISSSAGFNLARKLLGQAVKGADLNPVSQIVFVATTVPAMIEFVKSANLSFTQEQELEADGCAAKLLRNAGLDACQAWDEFTLIQPMAGEYRSTHPANIVREANYKARLPGTVCNSTKGPMAVVAKPVAPVNAKAASAAAAAVKRTAVPKAAAASAPRAAAPAARPASADQVAKPAARPSGAASAAGKSGGGTG